LNIIWFIAFSLVHVLCLLKARFVLLFTALSDHL